MPIFVKKYQELSLDELLEIFRLRESVFVVEQQWLHREVDEKEKEALHVFLTEEGELRAYLRVFPVEKGLAFMGRVIAVKRGCGLGRTIVKAGLQAAKEKLGAEKVILDSQIQARPFYEKCGFCAVSEPFLELGVPHIRMEITL